jgi:hypothetical protein
MSWPFMALVAASVDGEAVTVAKRYLVNVEDAWRACQATDMPFYVWCALLDKESKGKNIYGHDKGGVFNVAGEKQVTEGNFKEFYRRVVVNGETSNGVGPAQLTYRGFFPQMREQGLKAEVPYDNMLFGARLLNSYLARARRLHPGDVFRWAGTWYNAGPNATRLKQPYADDLAGLVSTWNGRVGG